MKLVLLLACLPFIAHASLLSHDHNHLARRDHSRLARRGNSNSPNKRCDVPRNRNNVAKADAPSPSPSQSPSSSHSPSPSPSHASSSSKPKPTGQAASVKGLLNVKSDCGDIGATKQVTATSGPNGHEDWLNCGIHDGGWRPPKVQIGDLIAEDLGGALKASGSPFKACSPYVDLFYKYAEEHSLPAILLATFALQESSCKPDAVGGAGEQGLMQITKDKCGGAPGGNCKDPDYNIGTGAKFFADTLAANEGNILLAIGLYNGWKDRMTFADATAAASGSCCFCQNNLDYLHQVVNGWLQNKNVYGGTPRIGKYFNLDVCHK